MRDRIIIPSSATVRATLISNNMKFYLPVITSLFLLSACCSSSVAEIKAQKTVPETEVIEQETDIAQNINPYIKDNIAPEISVKISSAENGGSGVIIARSDNTYLVLTNNHVLRSQKEFTINTHDGETHQATEVENSINTNDDLALLQFTSDKDYQTATINTAATPKAEQAILAVGYSAETGELVAETGKIERVPDKTLEEGYSIGYSSNIVQGMSGGAILNTNGEVIGINGKSAFPIVNTGYDNEDGTKPSAEEVEQYRQLSWGLSINRLLAQVDPEIITAYNLPLPETTDSIETPVLTGWLGELEAKAKQITVRIDSSSGANGSGVIIAKEGNTYTVLTADHVLCEKDDDYECIDYTYEIVAPDGKKYTLDTSKVKAEAGVDLATFKFISNESYQVAQLADYPIQTRNAVFVAGYPKLGENTPPQWQFSLGFGLDKERGLLEVNISNNSSNQENSAAISQSSLAGGYEMVYSSPTYGGMSGGAVLDKEGKVIGIHGQAEGETNINSQGGASNKIQLGYSLGISISTFIGLKARLGVGEISSVDKNAPAELNSNEQEALRAAILGTKIADSNATAKRWLERGNQLWRLLRYSEAVAVFDKVLELNEAEFNYLAHYGKGLALWSLDKDELVLASLVKATTSNSEFAPAFHDKSKVLQRLNRFDKALVAIDTAIAIEPKNANYYFQQAVILSDLKRLEEAIVASNRAIEIRPRAAFYNNRGAFYAERGEIELALADYNQAIKINPNYVEAYINRGITYKEQGEIELALADYNQALQLNPQYVDAYNNRGLLYQERGEVELALADYNHALQLDPNKAIVYYNRGNLHSKQEKLELALADYSSAIQLNSKLALAYLNRGNLYQTKGKLELALSDLKQSITINPSDPYSYLALGFLYEQMGHIEEELTNLQRAQQLFSDPKNANFSEKTSALLQHMDRRIIELVGNQSANSNESNPQSADDYYNRAFENHQKQEYDLALADYNQVIELDPSNEKAFINRGLIYQSQGKDEDAIADYNKAIQINPNNFASYRNRGVLYFEQSQYELAKADWDKAIAINPEDALTYYNRGLLYLKLSDSSSAKTDLEKAEELAVVQKNTDLAEKAADALEQLP